MCPSLCVNLLKAQLHLSLLLLLISQKAKKKPLAKMTSDELGIDIKPRLQVKSVVDPPVRQAGTKVENVDELISKLKDAGVI